MLGTMSSTFLQLTDGDDFSGQLGMRMPNSTPTCPAPNPSDTRKFRMCRRFLRNRASACRSATRSALKHIAKILADTVVQYPDLPIAPFKDMVLGMLMDTPGHPLAKDRYETWDDLYEYCYRVAGTVGLMTLPIMGTAPGFTQDDAKKPAEALGIAFQITNILRDVGEDAVRGRIYLPREDMDRFGVTEKQIFDGRIDDNYRELVKFEIARAREYYSQALSGIPMLAPSARLPVRSSLDMYSKILRRIEENEYDNFKKASARARGARVAPFSPSSLTDFVLSRSARTSPSWRNFWICRSRGG